MIPRSSGGGGGGGGKVDDSMSCASPVSNTHWAIPNRVLCGHSAGLFEDQELLMLVNDLKIDTFVCLQEVNFFFFF